MTLFVTLCGFSQTKKKEQEVDIIAHEVKLGESVRMLSKKYLVDPAEIYKLNKFAVEGISEGMVLKIPVPKKAGIVGKEIEATNKVEVANNQTEKQESEVVKTVPQKEVVTPTVDIKQIIITEDKTEVNHKVLPKETLYSLAREFSVSIDDLKANNPEVAKNGLQIGQVLKILTNKKVEVKQSTSVIKTIPKKEVVDKPVASQKKSSAESSTITHKVEPKETLYSLSKKYNVTIDQIKEQNAALLINGLQIGQVLEIKPNN